MKTNEIRELFPQLKEKVYGKNLVYFDNAATSLRPISILEKWKELAVSCNSNIHRAVHFIAEKATEEFEETRDIIKSFLNAEHREEIIFTSGTTAAINLVAFSFGEAFINEGDEIIVSEEEHHSNIVPWQMLCKRKKAVLKVLPISDDGILEEGKLPSLLSDKTKLVAVTQISNVLGINNPVKQIVDICHLCNIPVLVDGAQGVVHQKVNLKELDCDFYVFSGHKIFAIPGTGVLYGKRKWLEKMPPYMGGGEMIANVNFDESTYAPLPYKFEAGTQNFTGIPTLKNAIELYKRLNNNALSAESRDAHNLLSDYFLNNEKIRLYGIPQKMEDKISLFSFNIKGIHHQDVALILDKMGIAVRSGQMCAEPLMQRFGVEGMIRISLLPYNTFEEAEFFIRSLEKAINLLS